MQRTINGRHYPLWSQFIERKTEWIGGKLMDYGDNFDRAMAYKPHETEITDVTLEPNGEESAFFSIVGKDFTCGFSTEVGGISGGQEGGDWLVFAGYGGQKFKIRKKTIGGTST